MAHEPFDHVRDQTRWEFVNNVVTGDWGITLPEFDIPPFDLLGFHFPGHRFHLTKFMILEVVAALIIIAIYVPLSKRVQAGGAPRGYWWNTFESVLTFIRNEVAKPNIGEEDADHYVPFLWTLFLFILACNLLGMLPFLGSPTGSFSVTLALAIIAFCAIHGYAIAKHGVLHYLQSYVPHVDVPFGMGYLLIPMIVVIEVIGHFIKAFVLAVRLFANMFAGHTVLAFILFFILMAKDSAWYLSGTITIGSVIGVTALSLLELFVAFLQAFIFVFLTSLFMGSTLHPEH